MNTEFIQQNIKKIWEEEQEKIWKIKNFFVSSDNDYFYTIDKNVENEPKNKLKICCIDGRIQAIDKRAYYIREGGSGILRKNELDIIADTYKELARSLGVERVEITRHSSCGAEVKSGLREEEIIEHHENLKNKLQEEIGKEVCLNTIDQNSLEGVLLDGMHSERAFYFVEDDFFNPEQYSDILPRGFVFHSACSADREYQKANVHIALGIAFGKHGFGELFSSEEPFLLLGIGNGSEVIKQAKDKLNEVKESFVEKDKNFEDKIFVGGIMLGN